MDPNALKDVVKETYTRVVTQPGGSCCQPSCCSPSVETAFNEDYSQVPGYVPEADYGLGCGLPAETARIQPGQTVLDLGSGAGNDVFVARQLVGESGHVIGLDMTEAMVAQANRNKAKLGYTNVAFILGDIEAMPLARASVDVVISNCVLNLVPDKAQAFAEIKRVLRPGGHFSISDIVVEGDLAPDLRQAAALYAGCVGGALSREAYLDLVQAAGFRAVEVLREREIYLSDELLRAHVSQDAIAAFRAAGTRILSLTVYGEA